MARAAKVSRARSRRPRRAPRRQDELGSFLARDADGLDLTLAHLWCRLREATLDDSVEIQPLVRDLRQFEKRWGRHIVVEEQLVYPAIEKRFGKTSQWPGRSLRREHQEVKRLLALVRRSLYARAVGSLSRAFELLDRVRNILVAHAYHEESSYHVTADRMLTPAQTTSLLKKAHAI